MVQFVARKWAVASRSRTRFLRPNLEVNAMMPLIKSLISEDLIYTPVYVSWVFYLLSNTLDFSFLRDPLSYENVALQSWKVYA